MDKDQQGTQGMETVGMAKGETVVDFFFIYYYCYTSLQ